MNKFESSNDLMILLISFISSFEINKVNPFPALTGPFPLIFLSNVFIEFEGELLTNLGKLSLVKGKARSVTTFFYLNYLALRKNPPDWIIFDNRTLLSFLSINMFLAMAFLVLVVCLVVRNNSHGKSLSGF